MKQYALKCHCGRQEVHGYTPPAINLQTCCTARAIRAQCRDFGCRFELVEDECEFTDVDRLRLGLRGERAISELQVGNTSAIEARINDQAGDSRQDGHADALDSMGA